MAKFESCDRPVFLKEKIKQILFFYAETGTKDFWHLNFIMIRRHSEMNTEPLLFLFIYLSDRSISQPIYLNSETRNHPLKPLKS